MTPTTAASLLWILLASRPAFAQEPPLEAPVVAADAPAPVAEGAGGEESSPATNRDEPAADSTEVDAEKAAVYERLFGDPSVPVHAGRPAKTAEPDIPEVPGWTWPLGLLLVGTLAYLRWQVGRSPESNGRMRVVQRTMLGKDGHLAVVEVPDGADVRRLLIGYGSGAPRLVAELDMPPVGAPGNAPATTAGKWERAFARAAEVVPSGASSVRRTESAQATPSPVEAPTEAVRLKRRPGLIAEVLAEREESSAPAAPAQPDDTESEVDSETYTFRGLIG